MYTDMEIELTTLGGRGLRRLGEGRANAGEGGGLSSVTHPSRLLFRNLFPKTIVP